MNLRSGNKLIKLIPIIPVTLLAIAPLHAFAADPPHYQNTYTVYTAGGLNINDVASSDIDGDGKLDMIALQHNGNLIAILRGNGDGTFMAPQLLGVGSSPRAATVGDFNRDGINDIAVSNYSGQNVSILLGNADGTFQAAVSYSSGNGSFDVTSADLNKDGSLDLAVTNDAAGKVSILFGNGDGTFGGAVSHTVGAYPRSIISDDFNGDGNMDLICANDGSNSISVLLGDGHGAFSKQDYPSGSSPSRIAVGDWNGDGVKDLAVNANGDHGMTVLQGNADGSFQAPVPYATGSPASPTYPANVAAGDFNNDGISDLVVTNQVVNYYSIFFGNGDGTFQPELRYSPAAFWIKAGDFNEDGIPDLVFGKGSYIDIMISKSEGTIAFDSSSYTVPENGGPAVVKIVRSDTYGPTKVQLTTTDGSAVAGTDYTAVTTTISFLAGEAVKTYPIPTVNDAVYSGDRDFIVTLSAPTNGVTLGAQASTTVTIQEDEPAPVPDTTAPNVDALKFSAIDNYAGTLDQLIGSAGAVGETGANVRAYAWNDANTDNNIDAGELSPTGIALGTSAADGSVSAADLGDLPPGTYRYIITATDAAGNESQRAISAAVVFTLTKASMPSPVIQLNGPNPLTIPVGSSFTDPGATAQDANYGDLSAFITVTGTVYAQTPGDYTLRYNVQNPAGVWAAEVTRVVKVVELAVPPDTTAPTVDASKFSAIDNYSGTQDQLTGSAGAVGEPGASVRAYAWNDANTDNNIDAGELSPTGIALGTSAADGSVSAADLGDLPPGVYRYVITAADAAGNESPRAASAAVVFTLTKEAMPGPVIQLNGPNPFVIPVGSSFTDPGATAQDENYGGLSALITVTGSVYTETPGDYLLRYNVQNPAGVRAAEVSRIVRIVAPSIPEDSGGSGGSDSSEDTGNSVTNGNPAGKIPSNTNQVNININGVIKLVNVSYETSNGQHVTRIILTSEQLAEAFSSKADGILIEAQDISQAVRVDLPAAPLLNALKRQPDALIELVVNGNGTRIPLSVIKGVSEDAAISATIASAPDSNSAVWNDSIVKRGGTPLLPHPVVYSLYANGAHMIDQDNIYAVRTVSLPGPADPERATAVRIDESGRLHFAPSVFSNDGSPKVTIRSPYDGVYTTIQSDQSFADLNGHWAQKDIVLMANKLIVEGKTQDRFMPDDNISRAEFVALLVRALGLVEETGQIPFRDVTAEAWYAGAVRAARQAKLIDGYEDGTFRPLELITREQMAVMIVKAMEYAGHSPNANAATKKTFADEGDIAEWAAAAIERLTGASIIQGISGTKFGPRENASRAQSVVMLKRMLQALQYINP